MFIVDNWQWIVTAVLSIIIFILQLCKKRPVVKSLDQYCDSIIHQFLPGLIVAAEKSGEVGDHKKKYVIERCMQMLTLLIKLDDNSKGIAESIFSKSIEAILSTPRKK